MVTDRWPFLFNAIVDAFNLRELEVSRRRFTWLNNLEVQTFEKLDRILSCTLWDLKFLHTTVYALSKQVSDHAPLFLNTGETTSVANPPITTTESLITVGTFTNSFETTGGDTCHRRSMA